MRFFKALTVRVRSLVALMLARRQTRARLQRPIRHLLIVCYGNIYRSAFLGAYLADKAQGRFEVRSSGFHKKSGRPSPERHVEMSREAGVDLSAHRSQSITVDDVQWADVIVAMDRHNWQALRQLGAPPEKIVWAGALTSGSVEINDPYEMDDASARRTIERLVEAGDSLIERLQLPR
jgi:protein-tyrosine-phosphatase